MKSPKGILWCILGLSIIASSHAMSGERGKGTEAHLVARGKYLVNFGGCNDCHSTKTFGPRGPEVDTTMLLAGSPAHAPVPEYPASMLGPGRWGGACTGDMTAWAGPWGISFAANLTPDVTTGIGSWTETMFIKALRTGRHMGEGREILPPMPWQMIRKLSDEDLKAIYAYLRSIPPVENAVREPLPPPSLGAR